MTGRVTLTETQAELYAEMLSGLVVGRLDYFNFNSVAGVKPRHRSGMRAFAEAFRRAVGGEHASAAGHAQFYAACAGFESRSEAFA